jgi:hypothetical protein
VETLSAIAVQTFAVFCLLCAYPVRWVRTITLDVIELLRALVLVFSVFALLIACAPAQTIRSTQTSYIYIIPQVSAPLPVSPIRTSKKGIGLAYDNFTDDAQNVGASWCYNWSVRGVCGNPQIEFVAMIWGRVIPQTIEAEWILGANEPDISTQANITPEAYAGIWREIEARFADKKLVAPVPSQQDLTWLVHFRDAYVARYGQPPRLDALALHCYASHAAHCQVYAEWMIGRARAWNVPEVWLTEFGIWKCLNPQSYLAEIRNLVAWLEDEPMIARYAIHTNRATMNEWWMYGLPPDCNPSLFDFASGERTLIGEVYAGAQ